jgi:hypothetical protein
VADRTPDLTEPFLVVTVGLIVRALRPGRRENTLAAAAATPPPPELAPVTLRKWLAFGAGLTICGASAIAAFLHLPKLPYNVVELFHSQGAAPFLAIFVAAILWTGAVGVWLANRVAASKHPWLAWPTMSFVAALVLLALLSASVTQESIGDISGSNNLYYQVTGNGIWGEAWRTIFLWIGSPTPVAIIERPVRFAALLGPLFTGLALCWLAAASVARSTPDRLLVARLALWSVPWLFACKAIAFDWSSTDNLNELIARDGPWHLGGGGYLYLLLAAVCANAVLLARIRSGAVDILLRVGTTLLLPALTFSLLSMGLEQAVHKYGSVFSGVQFLLGPDRRQLLDPVELGLRWAAVQIGVTVMLAVGLRLAATFPSKRDLPPAEAPSPPSRAQGRGTVKLARHADMTRP